ncbi:hypothetical protein [Mycolicibacterium baixiangningiae]|nr:hypothetical protein [Mycolicibacterium baixiangningiae]
MNLQQRIAHHVRTGEAYRDAWKFAEDGVYVSAYFAAAGMAA